MLRIRGHVEGELVKTPDLGLGRDDPGTSSGPPQSMPRLRIEAIVCLKKMAFEE